MRYSLDWLNGDVHISLKRKDINGFYTEYWSKLIPLAVFDEIAHIMNEKELLFSEFFNKAMKDITVSGMTIHDLTVWIEELEKTVLEGKATLQAAHQSKREKIANLSESDRDKLLSSNPPLVSDALSAVKKRKERMSKADKLHESLIAAGMSEEDARKISGTIKVDESKQSATPVLSDSTKQYVFNGIPEDVDTVVCVKCQNEFDTKDNKHICPVCEEKVAKGNKIENPTVQGRIVDNLIADVISVKKDSKPFDPSDLF